MRNSANLPAPLVIDQSECVDQPISTTAKFEEYQRNREQALKVTPQELKKVPEHKREETIYIYLTPDEIWSLKDALKKIPPVSQIQMNKQSVEDMDNNHANTAHDFKQHQDKRQEFRALTDAQFVSKSKDEIEFYYQFLTPDEVLEQNERLQRLKAQ